MSVTYYVAVPFGRNDEGDLVPGEAIEVQSEAAAKARAKLMAINAASARPPSSDTIAGVPWLSALIVPGG